MLKYFILTGLAILLSVSCLFAQREITLAEVRQLALENNRSLGVARAHGEAAAALRKVSFSQFLPGLDFAAHYQQMNKPFNLLSQDMFLPVIPYNTIDFGTGTVNPLPMLNPDAGVLAFHPDGRPIMDEEGNFVFRNYAWIPSDAMQIGQKNNILMNLAVSQPLFTGGKIKAQYQAAVHMESLARYGAQLTESDVLFEVESLYWKMLSLQEKIKLTDEYKAMVQALLDDLEGYYQEGIIHRTEVLQAKVALNEARLDALRARNGFHRASMALCLATGLPLTTSLKVVEEPVVPGGEFLLDELWELGAGSRPELAMAEKQVDIAAALERVVRGGYFPDIALSAGYLAVNPNPYNGFEKEFGMDWTVGVTLVMPVFHWGERRNMVNAARLERKVQELKLEDAREMIRLDISNAWYGYLEMLQVQQVKSLSVQQAEENLRLSGDLFEVGRINATDLLKAQVLWHEARTELIDAQSQLRTSYRALEKATGTIRNP